MRDTSSSAWTGKPVSISTVTLGCATASNLFLREVVYRPVHPVLPLRREDINIDRILGEPELMRNVGRDDHDVAGVHHVFLALRINFRFSLSNPRDLLVGVVMQGHHGALFHDPFCESGLRAVQILPLNQRRYLLDRLSVQMVEREI